MGEVLSLVPRNRPARRRHSGTSLRLVSQLPEDEEPPSGFTDRLASIMTIASGQTLDEDDKTVTGGPELDAGSGKLHTELLVVSQVSGPLVVGALVPDRGAGESLVPLHREIVLAIAEACA